MQCKAPPITHTLSHKLKLTATRTRTLSLAARLIDLRQCKFRFSARPTLSNWVFIFLKIRFGERLKYKIFCSHPQCVGILALPHPHFRERLRQRWTQPPIEGTQMCPIIGIPKWPLLIPTPTFGIPIADTPITGIRIWFTISHAFSMH